MSVPFQRVSVATVTDIEFYDPAAYKRANSLGIDWDNYFNVGSQEILYQLEFGWWQKYADTVFGAYYYTNNNSGQLISAFNPSKLVKTDQTLIRLDVFRACLVFYESLVTDVSNMNDVDTRNFDFGKQRYDREWDKALQLMNFYDLYGDGTPITKLEENWTADVDYFNNDRRFF
jgi:hypothetical protein